MNKICVIKQSVGCQWLGIWSLLPVVGLAFAGATLLRYRSVCAEVGNEWNPARKQLVRGAIFAWSGVLITSLLLLGIVVHFWLESIASGGN